MQDIIHDIIEEPLINNSNVIDMLCPYSKDFYEELTN